MPDPSSATSQAESPDNGRPTPSPEANPDPNQALLRELVSHLTFLQQYTSADELGYYLSGIERRSAAKGERLYAQGAQVDRIFLIVSGTVDEVSVRLSARRKGAANVRAASPREETLLRRASSGTLLGLFDLVNGKTHSSSARTAADCDLIVLEAVQVNRLLYRYPELRAGMLPAARIDRLRTMPLLAGADNVAISYVADAAQSRDFKPGETIYQAGDKADRIYLVDQGQVRLDYGDATGPYSLWMGNGGDFGYGSRPQDAANPDIEVNHNAVALSAARLLIIPRQVFVAATGIIPEVEGARLRRLRAEALDKTGVFRAYTSAQHAHLLGFASHYYLPTAHLLTQQGDVADSLWVLLAGGKAVVHTIGPSGTALPDIQLEGIGFFNEDALRTRAPSASTLEANPGSSWLRIHWQDFSVFLEQNGRSEPAAALHLSRDVKPPAAADYQKHYDYLAPNERVMLEARRHWIVAAFRLAPATLLTMLFGWLLVLIVQYASYGLTVLIGAGVLGLLTLATWAWVIGDYLNDYLLITNLRVVRQEKVVMLRQRLQFAPLEKIQDVNLRQDALGVYLHFADIEVQTPGPSGNIRFQRAAQFERVVETIKREREVRRRHYQAAGKKLIYQVLENRFGGVLVLPSRVLALVAPEVPTPSRPPAGNVWLARLTGSNGRRNALTGKSAAAPPKSAASGTVAGGTPQPNALYIWHKHWIVLLRVSILPLLMLAAATVAAVLFYRNSMGGALIGVAMFFALIAFGWLMWRGADWYNDIYVLDNDQLIDIERRPLGLAKTQRSAGLRQIVDLRLDVPGPLHYLLNYGNVFVQTAATDGEFTFLNVGNPTGVMETIRTRLDESRVAEEQQAAQQRAQEFPDWLEVYSRLDRRRTIGEDNSGDEEGR